MLLNALINDEKSAGLTMTSKWLERFNQTESSAKEMGSFPTKASQKDAIEYANKLIKGMFDKVVEDSGLLAMDLSSGEKEAELGRDVYYSTAAVHTMNTLNRRIEEFAEVSEVGEKVKSMMADINAMAERALVLKAYEINKKPSKAMSEKASKEAAWKSLPKASSELVESLVKGAQADLDDMDMKTEKYLRSVRNSYEAAYSMSKEDKEVALRQLRISHESALPLALATPSKRKAYIKAQRAKKEDAIRYGATDRLGGLDVKKVVSSDAKPGIAGLSYSCRLEASDGIYRFSFQGIVAGGYNIQRAHLRVIFELKKEQ